MAQYKIKYLDGEIETVAANLVESDGRQYVIYRSGKPAGYIPAANVRSVLRQDDQAVTD
ncbi:hypothetical protein ABZ819_05355 [Streptomyces venezuelae]|uniref:hypothetical protein n=1 Tax=Streptomyces venezuelae TaxID=54571 RepID=UPI003445C184